MGILVLLNYINPIKIDVCFCFNYVWPSFEIIRVALTVLLLKKNEIIYTFHLFTAYNLQHISKMFGSTCSESQEESLQIFFKSCYTFFQSKVILSISYKTYIVLKFKHLIVKYTFWQ